jgi:hypothetical protein
VILRRAPHLEQGATSGSGGILTNIRCGIYPTIAPAGCENNFTNGTAFRGWIAAALRAAASVRFVLDPAVLHQWREVGSKQPVTLRRR